MRVAIYGSGAMGTVLGAFLAKNGQAVDLIDSYGAHVEALNEKGAKIVGMADFTVPVKAYTPEQIEGTYDIVFLFTKQTANSEVLPHLKKFLHEDSVVCTLQNGIPEYSVDELIGDNRTVGGTVLWGATFVGPGVSEVTQDVTVGDILFDIGEIDGQVTDRIKEVAKVLEVMGPVTIVENMIGARWSKLLLNSAMSGMSAALGSVFKGVLDEPKASACLSYIASEIVQITDLLGVDLEPAMNLPMREYGLIGNEEEFARSQSHFNTFYADKHTAKASMLQDLENGKKTEVEMINGFVVAAGKEHGIETPFNSTVVKIVQGIENGELELTMDNLKYFNLPEA